MKETKKGSMLIDPSKPYESLNKLPLMMRDYRSSMMRQLKSAFMQQLALAQQSERDHCVLTGATPVMRSDGPIYKDVTNLVNRCGTLFEMEALARFVFNDNEVPTWPQLKTRASLLEGALGFKLKS